MNKEEKVNFLKKILIGIIFIAFIAAAWTLTARVDQIDQNSAVEIVMDGKSYRELQAKSPQINLEKLKAKGVTTIAIYQQSLEDFVDRGSLERVKALDFYYAGEELKSKLAENDINIKKMDNSALFAVLTDSLKKQLQNLSAELESEYQISLIEFADYDLLYFPNWHKKLEDINLGYDSELLQESRQNDLKIAYRSNNKLNSLSALEKNLELMKVEYLIFDGEEITGYPDQIEKTAALLTKHNLDFGYVEAFIADQDGAKKLASLNNYQVLRTHSMQQEEVELAVDQKIIDRYLLSVSERNVKLIYHKPYLEGNNLEARNLELLAKLKSDLKSEGYSLGNTKTIDYFSNSNWDLITILIGVTAGGILLLNYFTAFKYSIIMNLFFLVAGGMALFLIQSGGEILLRQITALAAAVIYPSLAVILFLLERKKSGEKLTGFLSLSYLFSNFTAAIVTAFIGGVFVSAALNSSQFIFKIYNFRGVKIAFLMPLLIISLYYFLNSKDDSLKTKVFKLLEVVIKIKHIIIAAILFLIAVIYIGRTGNFPLLPVPNWELTIRSLLERLLYVRPRFKEFLIGHPLFILALYLSSEKRKSLLFFPILMLASVGVITVVNTFSHLHTPVMISIIRTFNAYWLSFIIAFIFIVFYKLLTYLYQKYYLYEVK